MIIYQLSGPSPITRQPRSYPHRIQRPLSWGFSSGRAGGWCAARHRQTEPGIKA